MSDPESNGGDHGRRLADRPELMAVRTELIREYLLDRIFDAVVERAPGDVSEPAADALQVAGRAVLGEEGGSPLEAATASELARRGYLTRVIETEFFERAQQPTPGLRERLSKAGEGGAAAMAAVSGGLARREPGDKPDPRAPDWTSWRVPGPGGHVRHYLALMTVSSLFPRDADGRRPVPVSLGEDDLKRCWLYGFYVRCCEEALAPDGAPA